MLPFPLSLATFTRSTGKPGDFASSKQSACMSHSETCVDGRGDMEHSVDGQGTCMLDEVSSIVDDTTPDNDYEAPTPYPFEAPSVYDTPYSISTTAFAEDICVVKDKEPVDANIQRSIK